MKIQIDGIEIEVQEGVKNLIEVTDENKIPLPAPCFRAEKKKGCCHGCAVHINGELKYACNTKPEDGMNIQVNTDYLKDLRRKNILLYTEAIKQGKMNSCGAGQQGSSGGCGCNC